MSSNHLGGTSTAAPIDMWMRVRTRHEREGLVLEYELSSPSGSVDLQLLAVQSEPLKASDLQLLETDLFSPLDKLLRVGKSGLEVAEELELLGKKLYRRLLPRPLRDAFRAHRGEGRSLLVVSDEPWVPWELIHPDEEEEDDFLCMDYTMGRWLSVAEQGPASAFLIRRLLCAESAEVTRYPTLRGSRRERQWLEKLSHEIPGLSGSMLAGTTFQRLMETLRLGGFEAIHFTGHGSHEKKDPDRSALILRGGKWLRVPHLASTVARRIRDARPLVFLNACLASRSGRALTGLGGWPDRWIGVCGCGALISPLWSVGDDRAMTFAKVFYASLHSGMTLGEAVLEARRRLRADDPAELTWLAYAFHGHPNAVLQFGDEVPEGSRARPRSAGHEPDPLMLPDLQWQADLSSPSALLQADYGIVPFHFRESEFHDLQTWCHDAARASVRLYTGQGGMGKTRLALEICRVMRAEGWQAGFIDLERDLEEIWTALDTCDDARLIVVDYAETHRPLVRDLAQRIHRGNGGHTRLLLLARSALEWWEQLKSDGGGVGELLSGPATSRHALRPVADLPDKRRESYLIAARTFAEKLGQAVPELPREGLGAVHFERVLFIHMSALAAVVGRRAIRDQDGILDHILARERRFWRREVIARGLAGDLAPCLGRALAVFTLAGGAMDRVAALQTLRSLECFRGHPGSVLEAVANLLHGCYPAVVGVERYIPPLQPDLLGEQLIMRELEKGESEILNIILGSPDDEDAGKIEDTSQ